MDMDGGRRVYHRLGQSASSGYSDNKQQKVCYHWTQGKCSRFPCQFLHSELSGANNGESSKHAHQGFGADNNSQGGGLRRSRNSYFNNTWGRQGSGSSNRVIKKMEKLCKHWLQGNCKFGDTCKYLHQWSTGDCFSLLTPLEGHQQVVTGIALPMGLDKLYTGSQDESVRVWDCQSGQTMGGHRGRTKESITWSHENEHAFIGILYDRVKSGLLQTTTFTKDEWGRINQAMIEKTKMDYGIDRLKGNWNRLRSVHRMFSDLLGHTGVTWDPNTNQVIAAEEVWQHFYAINKESYRLFRKEGCKHYETLGEIFSGTTATGGLGNASTQLPSTSDEERELEDAFLTGGVHVHVVNDDGINDITKSRRREEIGISGGRRRKEPKVSKSDKLEACMVQWSSTMSMRSEENELRKLYLQEKLAKLRGKSGIPSDSEATSPDPYSNAVCLDILNGMDGVSNEMYAKAITKFKDPDFRMSFVKMPKCRRGPVLELV